MKSLAVISILLFQVFLGITANALPAKENEKAFTTDGTSRFASIPLRVVDDAENIHTLVVHLPAFKTADSRPTPGGLLERIAISTRFAAKSPGYFFEGWDRSVQKQLLLLFPKHHFW